LSHALRQFPGRFDGRLEPVPWNEPHRLQMDVEVALTEALALEVDGQAAWGRRWAFRRAYYDYLALFEEPTSFGSYDLTRPSEQVVPAYYRLDAGLTYERTWARATVSMQAFIVNVFDRNNVYDWSLEQNERGVARLARALPGRHPVFSIRFSY
jgi:hypothetical protein